MDEESTPRAPSTESDLGMTGASLAPEKWSQGEAFYRNLAEQSLAPVFINRDDRIVFVSQAGLWLAAASDSSQILGQSPFVFLHPDDHAASQERTRRLLAGEAVAPAEVRLRRLDGEIRLVEVTSRLFSDQAGPGILVVMQDVTDRKQREVDASLLSEIDLLLAEGGDQEETFAAVGEKLAGRFGVEGMVLVDIDEAMGEGTILFENFCLELRGKHALAPYANADNLNLLKSGRTGFVKDIVQDPRTTQDASNFQRWGVRAIAVVPFLRSGQLTHVIILLRSGVYHWPAGEIDFYEKVAPRVLLRLERYKAEEVLRQSENRLREVLEHSRDIIYRFNLQTGTYDYISPAIESVLGYPLAEVMHANLAAGLNAIHPEDLPVVRAGIRRLEETGQANMEFRLRAKDGGWHWISDHLSLTRDPEGRPLHRNGYARDITASKRAEGRQQRYNRILAAINQILSSAVRAESLEEVGQSCLAASLELTGGQAGFVGELGEDGLLRDIAVSELGWSECRMQDQTGHRRSPGSLKIHGLYGQVIAAGRSLIANDPGHHPQSIGLPAGHPPLASFMGVPLFQAGQVVGLLAVSNRPGGFGRDQQEDLEAIAGVVVQALQRKRSELARARATADLAESERRYRSLFDLSPDLVMLVHEGRIEMINQAGARLLGAGRSEELEGRELAGCVSPEAWPGLRARIGEILQQEFAHVTLDSRLLRQDHAQIGVEISAVAITLRGERRLLLMAHDMTEREKAARSLAESESRANEQAQYLQSLLAAAPVVIWISHDRDCRRITGNRAAYEFAGMPEGANLSLNDATVAREMPFRIYQNGQELPPVELPMQRVSAIGKPLLKSNLDFVFRDGGVRSLLGNVVPIFDPDGRPGGAIGAYVEITELNEAQKALRLADRRKNEFLATLAHELRNPLAPIRNAVQLLKLAGPDPESQQRQQQMIDRQVSHMARLLDDLLDVSRITRGQITLRKQPLLLAEALQQAVEAIAPALHARCLTLRQNLAAETCWVEADRDRLLQVFGNLLNNAVKFTPERGQIWLDLRREEREAVLSVRDNGQGIAAELLPRLFDLFVQGPAAAGIQSGLGIGLSLVKEMVGLHGGSVSAASPGVGQGSEFVVRLPLARADETHHPGSLPHEPAAELDRRVLVVDDVRDSAESLAEVLESWGCAAVSAFSGSAALAVVPNFAPDTVILDLGMPDMDGYEVARRLRSGPQGKTMLVIALTGFGQDHDRKKTAAAGFDAHLVKPVELKHLRQLLERAAARKTKPAVPERGF